MLHIKYLFIFSLRFWQETLFLWQRNFCWLFQIKIPRLNLKTVCIDSLLCRFFVSSIALFSSGKKWLSYPSHAVNPYLHRRLINWTTAFCLSFCCTVLPRILNILIFMNRVNLIICICQLYIMLFHL